MRRIAALVTGGLDSVTLAHLAAVPPDKLEVIISADCGDRHTMELEYAQECAERLGVPWLLVDLRGVVEHLNPMPLMQGNFDAPGRHYTEDATRNRIVPNHNAIMLSIAFGIAAVRGCNTVATAIHAGECYISPDTRPEFVRRFEDMEQAALDGIGSIRLWAPFLDQQKSDIAGLAAKLGVPIQYTWSCLMSSDIHCGVCSACTGRREALCLASIVDPTIYQDSSDRWIESCLSHGTITYEQAEHFRNQIVRQ